MDLRGEPLNFSLGPPSSGIGLGLGLRHLCSQIGGLKGEELPGPPGSILECLEGLALVAESRIVLRGLLSPNHRPLLGSLAHQQAFS